MNSILTWEDVQLEDVEAFQRLKNGNINLFYEDIYKIAIESPREILLWDDGALAQKLNCDLHSIHQMKLELSSFFLSKSDAHDRFSPLLPKKRIKFGVGQIDSVLGGGILSSTISELYGKAGSGKTQLCLQLLATSISSDKKSNIFYICTQERFIIERLIDFLPYEVDQRDCMDRVHLQYFLDPEEELRFIRYELPFHMHKYKYKVIIYDGIASNARIIESAIEKSFHVNQVIGSFRRLLAEHDTAILITNQITDIPSEAELIQKSALGLSLDNNVNTKICLEYDKSRSKRNFNLVKSVFSAPSRVFFTIESHGIMGIETELD